jgi:hypothetical protein
MMQVQRSLQNFFQLSFQQKGQESEKSKNRQPS